MNIIFKKETFRNDFTYRNSPENIRRFPFPFHEDKYMYAVNMEPHVPAGPKGFAYEHMIDVDEHYVSEMQDRALVLKEDPLRCQALPHMMAAQWDTLELLMEHQAAGYPEHFTLTKNGDQWHWINRPMGIDQKFTFGDVSTLPYEPMEYITRQAQGDFCIVDQRDGNLWMDAGMVTAQADWSLDFDLGMNFMEWHGPVPLAHQIGVFDRALKFLLNLQQGKPVRRLNWIALQDTSPALREAIVRSEDQRFWAHSGIDWRAVAASASSMSPTSILTPLPKTSTISSRPCRSIRWPRSCPIFRHVPSG